jgi:sugar lactone lactonase YvrE
MAVPRQDGTIATRLKAVEDELKRNPIRDVTIVDAQSAAAAAAAQAAAAQAAAAAADAAASAAAADATAAGSTAGTAIAAKLDLLVARNSSTLTVDSGLITLDTINVAVAAGSTSNTVFALELDGTATGTGTLTVTFFYGAAQVGPTVQVPFTDGPVHVSVNDFLIGLTTSAAFTAKAQVTTGTGTVAAPADGAHLYIMGTSLSLATGGPGGTWTTTEWVPAGIINRSQGLAFSPSGDLFVADYGSHRIWKVTVPGHTASVFAGSGVAGHTNGTGTDATFNRPTPLAFDASGNLYVGDRSGVRKITPAGVVSDAYPGTAPFANVYDLTCDNSGNVYVVDQSAADVYKITPEGIITTLATVPGGGLATIDYDTGSGDLFVADALGRQLLRVTMAGVVTTLAALGSDPDGDPIFAAFDQSGVLNISFQNFLGTNRHILRYSPAMTDWLDPVVLDLGLNPAGSAYEQVIGIACSPGGDLVIGYQYVTRIDQVLLV